MHTTSAIDHADDMTQTDDDAALEILDGGTDAGWRAAPGARAEYPVFIRNGTDDWHEIDVSIADPVDWVSIKPARLSIAPRAEARTTITFSVPRGTRIAAGDHELRIVLHDFEGTRFGQIVSSVNILPAYNLAMSLSLRGPLLRRGMVDGIVVRCRLINRGNDECSPLLRPDPDASLRFQAPLVRVPAGGDVAFDIEAQWTMDALPSYPRSFIIYGTYQGGEASAAIPWTEIAACLGTALPPLAIPEEFPGILPPRSMVSMAAVPQIEQAAGQPRTVASAVEALAPHASAVRVQINGAPAGHVVHGRRLHPWWPPIERFAGRLVVKPLPSLVAVAIAALVVIALLSQRMAQSPGPDPIGDFALLSHPSASHTARGRIPSISALHRRPSAARTHDGGEAAAVGLPRLPSPHQYYAVARPQRSAAQPRLVASSGDAWRGWITHVSATNVKVYDPSQRAWRSFVLLPGFRSVYAARPRRQVALSDLRTGAAVQVLYSYIFGMRRAREIDLLSTR
ncbi:MAG: hypothetical protein JOZ28_07195 [Candidatus Eremiobacteraeota bacterium]|nr:hypothetical protein [Candidatus Eremiobacteraeota bacterium]